MKKRCEWCGSDPLYTAYHDNEWGVPAHDDRHLFEMLVLEGAQAGLSWLTILRKREGYRQAFDGFDPEKVAAPWVTKRCPRQASARRAPRPGSANSKSSRCSKGR